MHPDLPFAVAKAHEHEMRARAVEARRAAELDRSDRGQLRLSLARIEFRHRVGAVRVRIAHA